MTRLRTEWVRPIEDSLEDFDSGLKLKTGCTMAGIAAKSWGMSEETFAKKAALHKVGSVPITQGEGVIGSFAQSVAVTAKVIGADSFVTDSTDVSGVYEAIGNGADILFMADDDRFISLNIKTGAVGDNNICTAMGYVKALELMVGDLEDKELLVLGCGIVGREIIKLLLKANANVTVYDTDDSRMELAGSGIKKLKSNDEIKNFLYIMDATNTGNWLEKDMLNEKVTIASLGIPLSLTDEAMKAYGQRVVHDLLPLGTAVMLAAVI